MEPICFAFTLMAFLAVYFGADVIYDTWNNIEKQFHKSNPKISR